MQPTGGIVGLDMGIARFVTLSDGSHIDPLNSFKKHQQRLKRYQRRLARKVKFSQNWKKAKAKVSQIHINIGNARKDYLHQASAAISQNHAIVCIEDLQVRNRSKSSKGNAETHGKQVRQKSGLNRAILDQGWGEFRRQLDYKLAWRGGHLIAVPPHNTSWAYLKRESPQPSPVRLRRMWLQKPRRCGGGDQCFRAGTPLVSLWRVGATRPLGEARTRRSASGASLTAVGIPHL